MHNRVTSFYIETNIVQNITQMITNKTNVIFFHETIVKQDYYLTHLYSILMLVQSKYSIRVIKIK
jgi:hypothetical protein